MKRLFALFTVLLLLVAFPLVPALAAGGFDSGTADKIDQYIEQVMKAGKIPGLSLAIVEGTETVCLKGYGYADGNRPVTPQTPFTVCSVGKTFTALAIRQLAGQGKIDYDKPVQAYIPWFTLADPEAAKKITIRHLIGHKSGLARESGTASWLYNPNLSIEDAVRGLKDVKPVRPAGDSEEYCNLNFIILGLVVQNVSGMPYAEHIQKYVFEPIGMTHSYLDDAEARRDGSAMGHSPAFGIVVPYDVPQPMGQLPAGFQQASAEDLANFAKLYLNNGYVGGKPAFENNPLPELTPPYPEYDSGAQRYGIYWMPESGPVNGYKGYFSHEGGSSNFSTILMVSPSSKRAIVVLTNCRNGSFNPEISARTIGNDIASMLELGMGLPVRTAGFGPWWISAAQLAAAAALLLIRAVWIRRFRKNITSGKIRKAFALASYAVLDGALPLAVLVSTPLVYRSTWPAIVGFNVEMGIFELFTCAALLAIFAVKTAMLLLARKKHVRDAKVNHMEGL